MKRKHDASVNHTTAIAIGSQSQNRHFINNNGNCLPPCFANHYSYNSNNPSYSEPSTINTANTTRQSICVAPFTASPNRNSSIAEDVERDDQLVKELNDLSMDERQKAFEDIHGVADKLVETPQLIQESLQKMEQEIRKIPKRAAYEKALFLSPRYVNNPKFRLIFLRCESFNAKAAAKRYVNFFDYKLGVFGHDKLVKDVDQADLDEDDMTFLKQGLVHLLPKKDRSGRAVLAYFNAKFRGYIRNMSRSCFYFFMRILQMDEEIQKRGMVNVMYECVDEDYVLPFDLNIAREAMTFYAAVPILVRAYHFCYDDAKLAPTMTLIKYISGTRGRVRFRAHYGSDTENRFQLLSFGIPSQTLPVTHESRVDVTYLCKWLDGLRREEEEQPEQQRASHRAFTAKFPTAQDVIMGRGRPIQNHPGNLRLNAVIGDNWRKYTNAGRAGKMTLFTQVVADLRDSGTRFLQKRPNPAPGELEWGEVDDATARDKVSHTFRNIKMKKK